jgi:hypothetical protein
MLLVRPARSETYLAIRPRAVLRIDYGSARSGPQRPERCAWMRDTRYTPPVRNAVEMPPPPNGLGVI